MPDSDTAAKPALRQDLEILRIASAFGIVLFHSGRDTFEIGYGGLVVFLILSGYFATAHAKASATIRQILTKRASRLLAPWAVWMVLYGARNRFFADRNILETDRGWINGLLAGTQIHLWYLPFIFFASVGLDLVVPRVSRRGLGWAAGLGAVAVLASASVWRPRAELHGYPTVQYCHAAAGVLIGILFACRPHIGTRDFGSLLLAVFGAIGTILARHVQGVAVPYLAGTLLCAAVLIRPLRLPPRLDVRSVSGCMFGVYLGHIFFDRIYNIAPGLPDLWEPPLTFVSSLAAIWTFRRFLPRAARWTT
jgi:hypothetical protein